MLGEKGTSKSEHLLSGHREDTAPRSEDNLILKSKLMSFLLRHLEAASVEESQIKYQLQVFENLVLPLLWAKPVYKEGFLVSSISSVMCSDDSPVEMSMCWKPTMLGSHKAEVRYTFDITQGSGDSRLTLRRVREQFQRLEGAFLIEEADWDLWLDLTCVILFSDSQHAVECEVCPPSNLALGFDLAPICVKGKIYWFMPACLNYGEHLDLLDRMFVKLALNLDPSYFRGWMTLRKFATKRDKGMQFSIISLDSRKGSLHSRIKLYTHIQVNPDSDLQDVFRIMSMDGDLPISLKLIDTVEKIWSSFDKHRAVQPSYVLVYFDIVLSPMSGGYCISSKINIPIHDTTLTDAEASQMLLDSLQVEEMKHYLV